MQQGAPQHSQTLPPPLTTCPQCAVNRATRAARFDALRDRFIDSGASIAEERGGIEGTDIAATIARVQADQLSLDAAQSLFARINRRTLFDLLG